MSCDCFPWSGWWGSDRSNRAFSVVEKRLHLRWLCQVGFLVVHGQSHVVSSGVLNVHQNSLTGGKSVIFWWYNKQTHSEFVGFQSKHFALTGEHLHPEERQMVMVTGYLWKNCWGTMLPISCKSQCVTEALSTKIWWPDECMNEVCLCW